MSTILETIRTAVVAALFFFGFLFLTAPGGLSFVNGIGATLLLLGVLSVWRAQ